MKSASFRPAEPLLQSLLGLLCLAATTAVLQALLFPSWPQVGELSQARLGQALGRSGLPLRPLLPRPGRRSADLTGSRQLGWRLADGSELWLQEMSVRRYEDLQVAYLARNDSRLRMSQRHLDVPLPGSASGRIQAHPAVQTCLVPQARGLPVAAVRRTALLKASDPRRQLAALQAGIDPGRNLATLLLPRRFSCVLVTLRSGSRTFLPADLWSRLLPALQRAWLVPESDVATSTAGVP